MFGTKQTQEYENMIYEYTRLIITSKTLSYTQISSLQSALKFKEARKFFVKALYFKRVEVKGGLSEKSFQFLYTILFNLLLDCNDSDGDFEDIRYITKTLFAYYKIENQKEIFVYSEIVKKRPCNHWNSKEFWEKYLEFEYMDRGSKLDDTSIIELITSQIKVLKSLCCTEQIIKFSIHSFISKKITEKEKVRKLMTSLSL